MSKIFYDPLTDALEEVEREIEKVTGIKEEKEELWKIIDEIVHHRVLGCILEKLPHEHHQDFLEKFHKAPHDENLFLYLKEKINDDVEAVIKEEIGGLAYEILKEIRGEDKNASRLKPR